MSLFAYYHHRFFKERGELEQGESWGFSRLAPCDEIRFAGPYQVPTPRILTGIM